jgi:hypothetical protein
MTPVLQQAPPSKRPAKLLRMQPPSLGLSEVRYGYRPGRSLGLSIFAHSLVLVAILLSRQHVVLGPKLILNPPFEPDRSTGVLYLPTLGGGSEGAGETGGAQGSEGELSSGLRARSRRGFAYPGPQPLVSNPPGATPGIQTLLQPSLENLPRLRRYLPLPNIVQPAPPAAAETSDAKPLIVVKSEQLSLRQPAETPVAPKITLPVAPDSKVVNLIESKPELPQRAVPDAVEASELSGIHKNQNGLLVLNAVPPPPDVSSTIPRAEARAQFADSLSETTVIADPAAGTKAGGQSSMAAGSGSPSDIRSGDALAEIASGGDGTNHGTGGSGTGSGGRYGSGQGSGLNADGAASGVGRGAGSGPGTGTGSATVAGSGTGAGSAPGGGGFRGITIQGGRYGNGNGGNMLAKSGPRRQTSYNTTIVSTGSSGGGLPDFGVFRNEKVYTVYVDMRANDEDPSPSWTLQYAVLQQAANESGNSAGHIRGTPTPPYATLKEVPEFAPEVMRRSGRRLIVASAILDTSGKLQEVSVRQSPESELAGPLVEALKHWMFEPSQIDGRPVALKILLGIRLAVPR